MICARVVQYVNGGSFDFATHLLVDLVNLECRRMQHRKVQSRQPLNCISRTCTDLAVSASASVNEPCFMSLCRVFGTGLQLPDSCNIQLIKPDRVNMYGVMAQPPDMADTCTL